MSTLLNWVLQPVGIIFSGLTLTLLLWLGSGARPRLPFSVFLLSSVAFLIFAMPSFANALVKRIETARENPAFCEKNSNEVPIVILGGGIDLYVPSDNPYETLQTDSLIRTLRAPEFATENTQYYLLGGGNERRSLAASMRQVLINRNVSENNIIIETVSQSTVDNAKALNALLPSNTTINLLTSKLHIKRASATFEKAGYQVCHIGVDSLYSTPKPPVSLLPYLSGLQKSTLAFHELLAWQVYKIKGHV